MTVDSTRIRILGAVVLIPLMICAAWVGTSLFVAIAAPAVVIAVVAIGWRMRQRTLFLVAATALVALVSLVTLFDLGVFISPPPLTQAKFAYHGLFELQHDDSWHRTHEYVIPRPEAPVANAFAQSWDPDAWMKLIEDRLTTDGWSVGRDLAGDLIARSSDEMRSVSSWQMTYTDRLPIPTLVTDGFAISPGDDSDVTIAAPADTIVRTYPPSPESSDTLANGVVERHVDLGHQLGPFETHPEIRIALLVWPARNPVGTWLAALSLNDIFGYVVVALTAIFATEVTGLRKRAINTIRHILGRSPLPEPEK